MGETKGTIQQLPIESLHPAPDNYRAHPPEQIARIAESLRRYGQRRAIVVQASTMQVIAGNGVLLAAPEAGLEKLTCDVWDCDDQQALAYLVEDNEAVWGAEDDRTKLAELLADLPEPERPPSFPDERIEDLLREVTRPASADNEETATTLVCPQCGYTLLPAGREHYAKTR